MNEFTKEEKKLNETINEIDEIIEKDEKELDELYGDFTLEKEDKWRRIDEKEYRIKKITSIKDKPYFARIDFQYQDKDNIETFYIGRHGISEDTKVLVTDWRAPISSLYYDSEIGDCTFVGPLETIKGKMYLKRQLEIEEGKLLNYFDVNLVTNDGLLQKYLNSNNDTRLKSIVSTIQKEQNNIIRKRLSDNIIVQGVAGSGKTTVALHRIAYLVYNYIKTVKQNEYLVIGPNSVFIKYIKNVLPDLDVDSVSQYTFVEFTENYINEKLNINSQEEKATNNIEGNIKNDIDKFKCSLKYKAMIDMFLDNYVSELFNKDLMLGDFKVISQNTISKIFKNSEKQDGISNRVIETTNALIKYISNHEDIILSRYNDYSYELFQNETNESNKKILIKKFTKDRDEIKKSCRSIIRNYFSKFKDDITKIYKLFINSILEYNLFNYPNLDKLKKDTMSKIKKNCYDFEDLAALIYLKSKISPNDNFKKIRQTVIDEAQDLGEFNFYVLKKCLPSSTFSIYGDLAQAIYDYRSVDNWEIVNRIMFNNDAEINYFNKSYRTTREIMEVADDILEHLNLNRSELVVRSGNKVTFSKAKELNVKEHIKEKITEYQNMGYKTIAVISKTEKLSLKINQELKDIGVNIPNVSINDDLTNEEFNVCTISNQLAKGLEFDAVIINNASENIYSSNSTLDLKLLYVAITRALHELDILYVDEINKILKSRV